MDLLVDVVNCQPDKIENHLGDKPLSRTVKTRISLTEVGNPTPLLWVAAFPGMGSWTEDKGKNELSL